MPDIKDIVTIDVDYFFGLNKKYLMITIQLKNEFSLIG